MFKLGVKLLEAAHSTLRKDLADPALHTSEDVIEVELHSQLPAKGFYVR